MTESSDAVLVRQVLAGDAHAYADLVARYRNRLGRYAVRMLGNQEDAEEALQDAFIRAYRSLARCDPERFGAWLFGILVNRCRTAGARGARRRRMFVHRDDLEAGPPVRHPAEDLDWRQAIEWALERLQPLYREAFILKHVEELEYDEMSRMTGATVSALKMRVKRAREQLRAALQEVERA